MNNKKILRRIAPVAAALALGGGVGAAVYAGVGGGSGSTTTTTVAETSTVQPAARTTTVSSLTQLYKTVTPGVVDITVTSTSSGNGFGSQQTQAEGTGFVYDTKGDILTAAHVVDGASTIKVHFQDGKTATATLVGKDDSTDTAVIKVSVDSSELHPLTMGSSASVQPGQEVVGLAEIGNRDRPRFAVHAARFDDMPVGVAADSTGLQACHCCCIHYPEWPVKPTIQVRILVNLRRETSRDDPARHEAVLLYTLQETAGHRAAPRLIDEKPRSSPVGR